MARAQIISEIGAGKYTIQRTWAGRSNIQTQINVLNTEIVKLQNKYDAMPESTFDELFAKNIVKMQIASLQKRVAYLTNNMPTDKTVEAWCADYTEGLTGEVGTIDIAGEYTSDVNIRPGEIESNAYSAARDGDLYPAITLGPWTTLLNQMIYPGWQKFKPLHRYATIIEASIDYETHKCAVAVKPTFSLMNYNVNRAATGGGENPAAQKGVASNVVKNYNVNYGDRFGIEEIEQLTESYQITKQRSLPFYTQNAAAAHPGFLDFVERYPDHPISNVTALASPVTITDDKYIQIARICRHVDYWFFYESDRSGYNVSDHWDVMYDLGDPWYWTPISPKQGIHRPEDIAAIRANPPPQTEFFFGAVPLEYDDINIVGMQTADMQEYLQFGTYLESNVNLQYQADKMNPIGPRPKRRGDCEDFVLTKMQMIIEAGILDASNLQILLCYVVNAGYHAVLGIQTASHGFIISDQRDYGQLWEINQLSRTHHWESFSVATAAGGGTPTAAKAQVVLTDVPIEYMGCNSAAFVEGDDVIVEFINQDWSTPKVIGFESSPASCGAVRILPDGTGFSYSGDESPVAERTGVFSFFYASEIWTLQGSFSGVLSWFASCTGTTGIVYRVGGYDLGTGGLYELKPVYTDEHWAYDVATASWQAATASGLKICKQRYKFIGNGNAILYGGEELTDSQYWGDAVTFPANVFYSDTKKYSFSADAWTSMLAFRKRSHPASFVINEIMYVAGGRDTQFPYQSSGEYNSGLFSFDQTYETWMTKMTLPTKFGYAAGFSLNGKGYLGGGCEMERSDGTLPNATLKKNYYTNPNALAYYYHYPYPYHYNAYCGDDILFNVQINFGALHSFHPPNAVDPDFTVEYAIVDSIDGGFVNTGVGLYYDPLGDAWSHGTCHPNSSWAYSGFAHCEIDGNQKGVRVGGGQTGSTGAFVLDEATDSWTTKGGYDPTWSKKFGQSGIGISA